MAHVETAALRQGSRQALGCSAEQLGGFINLMFVNLAPQSELPAANEAKEFPCGAKTICVANVNGTYTAMDNVCLHRGGPLGQGMIDGGKVICPWHGWAWDVKTGVADQDASAKVAMYPLKIENGQVLIEV